MDAAGTLGEANTEVAAVVEGWSTDAETVERTDSTDATADICASSGKVDAAEGATGKLMTEEEDALPRGSCRRTR